jgi:branched-chain amino acid aminotransferase
MKIEIVPLNGGDIRIPDTQNLGFGGTFSTRMFIQHYAPENGWHDARIMPFQDLNLSPATAVLHYSQTIFEGTKAYRRPDGDINLFRPMENMRRFNESAKRMAMPLVDEEEHLEALMQLVALEHEWVPDPPGAMYIRPVLMATDEALGVHSSKTYAHYIIVGPVGSYFREGFNPVPVYVTDEYVRAVVGGTGAAKTGGNYAASLYVGAKAKALGYSQVLWLDAKENRYVEEVGAMNIYFVYDGNHLVTPALTGSILPGITRKSVLTLGRDLGYQVSEGQIDIYEALADIDAGRSTEVFGCGTAAVIAPVGKFGFRDREYIINRNEVGPVAKRLYDELTGIQFGRLPDRFDWTVRVPAGTPEPTG